MNEPTDNRRADREPDSEDGRPFLGGPAGLDPTGLCLVCGEAFEWSEHGSSLCSEACRVSWLATEA